MGNEEGKGEGSKGNGDVNLRVAGEEEDEGCTAMALTTRMAGKWTEMSTKRAMTMVTRVAGKQRQGQRQQRRQW